MTVLLSDICEASASTLVAANRHLPLLYHLYMHSIGSYPPPSVDHVPLRAHDFFIAMLPEGKAAIKPLTILTGDRVHLEAEAW